MKKLYCSICMFAIIGCASFPANLKTPSSTDGAIIAVSIISKAQVGPATNAATRIYFIKIGEKENANKGGSYIVSNYVKDNIAYLIDAKPGKYVIAASSINKTMFGGIKYKEFDFLTKEAITATEITVKPATFNYIGKIVLQNKVQSLTSIQSNGDEAQKYYAVLLESFAKEFKGIITDDIQSSSLVSIDKSVAEKDVCISKAKEAFKDTGWIQIIK